MIEQVIAALNQLLAQLSYHEKIFCLCELVKDAAGVTRPLQYHTGGEFVQVNDFDKYNGLAYWRKGGDVTIGDEEDEVPGCAIVRKYTIPLKLVSIVPKDKLSRDDAYSDDRIGQTLDVAFNTKSAALKKALKARKLRVSVTGYTTDNQKILGEEYAGLTIPDVRYKFSYLSADVTVEVIIPLSCVPRECDLVLADIVVPQPPSLCEQVITCLTDNPAFCDLINACLPAIICDDVKACICNAAADRIPVIDASCVMQNSYLRQDAGGLLIDDGKLLSSSDGVVRVDFGSGAYFQVSTDAGALTTPNLIVSSVLAVMTSAGISAPLVGFTEVGPGAGAYVNFGGASLFVGGAGYAHSFPAVGMFINLNAAECYVEHATIIELNAPVYRFRSLSPDTIPQLNATMDLADGTWRFSGNDLIPITTCSSIGDATHRVSTVFMCSTIDLATDTMDLVSGGDTLSLKLDLLTANRTQKYPDKTGTFTLLDDVYFTIMMIPQALNPADSTSYYWGNGRNVPNLVDTNNDFKVGIAFTVIAACISAAGNTIAGTGEASTLKLRNTTQATSSVLGTFTTSGGSSMVADTVTHTGLSVAVGAGDLIAIQWDTPAWVINPVTVRVDVILTCRRG